jgi:hypothetical protein
MSVKSERCEEMREESCEGERRRLFLEYRARGLNHTLVLVSISVGVVV